MFSEIVAAMAVNIFSCGYGDDDYIDMEVNSYPSFLFHTKSSPQPPGDFEFQMSFTSWDRETSTSPADELFYKGKLLPLHLPPRLQMVEKLLQNSASSYVNKEDAFEEFYCTPLATAPATPTTNTTPFDSCNASPSESCQVSRELCPEEYMSRCSSDVGGLDCENQKNSWTQKLKQSSLSLNLRASRAFLRSLFSKTNCSHKSYAAAMKNVAEGPVAKTRESLHKYQEAKTIPSRQFRKDRYQNPSSVASSSTEKKRIKGGGGHRRSLSASVKQPSAFQPSTSGSSAASSRRKNSRGFNESQLIKKCSSAYSEVESSIQGAIAHCKKSQSQQILDLRNAAGEAGFKGLSTSRIAACDHHERHELCRG